YAIKQTHIRRQNELLQRCRALFLLALQAFEFKNERVARSYFARIRRLEARWRYGNTKIFRFALVTWAIGIGSAGFIVLRAFTFLPLDWRIPIMDDVRRVAGDLPILSALSAPWGALWGAIGLSGPWTSLWIVDDCGDRLQRLLDGGHTGVDVSE